MKAKKILVMGVSGCGKSSVGSEIAERLGLTFFDGDDFHPQHNVDKMSQGVPLTDEDRYGWLKTLNKLFIDSDTAVIACSALKPQYRDILRENNQELVIVYLKGDYDTIWSRLSQRDDHYFQGERMLRSQFDTLIEPQSDEAIFVDIAQPMSQVVDEALQAIAAKS